MKKYGLTTDVVFKEVFLGDTKESKEACKGLIEAMLKREVKDLKLKRSESPPHNLEDKTIVFDILVTFNDGEIAAIEMQVQKKRNDKDRFTLYLSRVMNDQALKGKDYEEIKHTYLILFTCYTMKEDSEEYIHRINYRYEDNELFHDNPQIIVAELNKIHSELVNEENIDEIGDDTALMYYLKYCNDEDKCSTIKLIKESRGFISMADKVYQDIQEERIAAILKTMAEMREMDMIRDAKEEGREEGKIKGFIEGEEVGEIKATIKHLKSMIEEMPIEKASSFLKITVEEAKALLEADKQNQE